MTQPLAEWELDLEREERARKERRAVRRLRLLGLIDRALDRRNEAAFGLYVTQWRNLAE